MSEESNESLKEKTLYRRRTVMGAIAAGAGLSAAGGVHAQQDQDDEGVGENWVPPEASEAHVAVLTGQQAQEMSGGGCAHITPQERDTLAVDVLIEDIQCVTQAHIHEGERGDDGPIVAPLFEYTDEPDGSGEGDPITTTPETPLIEGTTVDDPELVDDILADPSQYYVNVHTTHNPEGEIRGQIRGFDLGQETDLEPQPAEFAVSNLDPQDANVTQGDSVDISASVRNMGDLAETQAIEFRIGGDIRDEETLELGCRQVEVVTFTDVEAEAFEPGEYEYTVSSEEDSDSGTITVEEETDRADDPPDEGDDDETGEGSAEFIVSDLDPEVGGTYLDETFDVSATIENVGDLESTQIVEFRMNTDVLAEQELELDSGESETVIFEDIDADSLDPERYEHGIFTDDGSMTGIFKIVDEHGSLLVVTDIEPEDGAVIRDRNIEISSTVKNVGEERIETSLHFSGLGTISSTRVNIEPGEFQTVTLYDRFYRAESMETAIQIYTYESVSRTVSLNLELPNIIVTQLESENVTVTEEETFDILATVENEGEGEGTEDIELEITHDINRTQELTLGSGDSETIAFEDIDADELGLGEYRYNVSTWNSRESGILTIESETVGFAVSDLDPTNTVVTQGEPITVSADVENVGQETGERTVEYRIEGDVLVDQELELDAGQSEQVTFPDVDTAELEPDRHEHGIFTEGDSETGMLTVDDVGPPGELVISDLDPVEATVTQGDVIDVSATIENTGGQEASEDIEFRIREYVAETDELETVFEETQEFTLDPGESDVVTFENIDTGTLGPGDYEHGIFSENDSETGTVTVEGQPAEFTVLDLDPIDVTVTQDDLIDVQATIENTGEEEGTQTVELRVDGDVLGDEELTLDADESELVIFADIDTGDLDPGEYEHGVFTDDDSQTGTLTIEEEEGEPAYDVLDITPSAVTVTDGDSFEFDVTIENVGDGSGDFHAELLFDGTYDAYSTTLDPGQTETFTMSGPTYHVGPGEHEATIYYLPADTAGSSDTETVAVTVEEEPEVPDDEETPDEPDEPEEDDEPDEPEEDDEPDEPEEDDDEPEEEPEGDESDDEG